MHSHSTKVRRSRKSTAHIKTGCFTCKLRHVKCDERRPTCRRCEKYGTACDGYATQTTVTRHPKRLKTPDPIIYTIRTTLFENTVEKNCFDYWQRKRVIEAHALVDSASWTQLIFRSSHISSIRYCIIALGALELALAHAHTARAKAPSTRGQDEDAIALNIKRREETANMHHGFAIKYFDKALKQMRADTKTKRQNLRTTLMTCLLIHWFESFNGNYPLAVSQIRTGDELILEWRASIWSQTKQTRFPSPDPMVVEDELVQAIGNLAIQTFTDPDPRPQERKIALEQDSREMSRCIPSTFTTIKQARLYLDNIMKQLLYVMTGFRPFSISDINFENTITPSSYSSSSSKLLSPYLSSLGSELPKDLVEEIGAGSTASSTQNVSLETPTQSVFEDLATNYLQPEVGAEEILAKLRQWHQALRIIARDQEMQCSAKWLLLQLHYKTCVLAVSSPFMDAMAYDRYRDDMIQIAELSSRVLDEYDSAGEEEKTFIPDFGVILPLYFTGVSCRFPAIRARIKDLLLKRGRREGVTDSILLGKVVEWVGNMEEKYLQGEGDEKKVPGWARTDCLTTSFDLQKRIARVTCFQRDGPDDPVRRKREAVLTW